MCIESDLLNEETELLHKACEGDFRRLDETGIHIATGATQFAKSQTLPARAFLGKAARKDARGLLALKAYQNIDEQAPIPVEPARPSAPFEPDASEDEGDEWCEWPNILSQANIQSGVNWVIRNRLVGKHVGEPWIQAMRSRTTRH